MLNGFANRSYLIHLLVDGKTLPLLLHLYINLEYLESTSFKADRDPNNELEEFYKTFKQRSESQLVRPHLSTYINGVRLDLTRPFDDYHFDQRLIVQHSRNLKNGLVVRPCLSVTSTNFADVNTTYPVVGSFVAAVAPLDAATQRYARFHELYPCIQAVKLICPFGPGPSAAVFLDFLRTCRELTELEIHGSAFVNAFCSERTNVPSCQALRILTLFSVPGELNPHMKFQFLSEFTRLRRFHTNLATLTRMAKLVKKKLATGQEFRFRFSENDYELAFDIRKTENTAGSSEYDLKFERKSLTEGSTHTVQQHFSTLTGLVHNSILQKVFRDAAPIPSPKSKAPTRNIR